MIRILLLILLTAGVAHAGDLPGPETPGAINPQVTQDNLAATVCAKPTHKNGKAITWTSTIRPSAAYTNKLKAAQLAAQGLTGDPHLWEEDHRIPLECGGNPTDPANLSPELWDGPYGAHVKDVTENYERRRLCKGLITLAQCQAIFLGDWRTEYDRVYGPRVAAK